jgi:hypothetical protein
MAHWVCVHSGYNTESLITNYSVLEHIQNYNKLHIHKGALGQPRLRLLTVAGRVDIVE